MCVVISSKHHNHCIIDYISNLVQITVRGYWFQIFFIFCNCLTRKLGNYVCAVIKNEELVPINTEFGLLTISRIRYCMVIISSGSPFKMCFYCFSSSISIMFEFKQKSGHLRSKGHRFGGQVRIWDVSSKRAIYHTIFTIETHFNVCHSG